MWVVSATSSRQLSAYLTGIQHYRHQLLVVHVSCVARCPSCHSTNTVCRSRNKNNNQLTTVPIILKHGIWQRSSVAQFTKKISWSFMIITNLWRICDQGCQLIWSAHCRKYFTAKSLSKLQNHFDPNKLKYAIFWAWYTAYSMHYHLQSGGLMTHGNVFVTWIL